MFLEQRQNYFTPPQFNLSGSTILGQRATWPIDRTWPIEEIIVHVGFTVTSSAMTQTTAGTPDTFDNILQLVSRITLGINDGTQPRNVIDISGVGALEYCSQVGFNLDQATLQLIALSQNTGASAIGTGAYELTYRIPMVNPMVGEPLRSRMLLPVHTFPQDPVLTLYFNTLAGMGLTVGTMGAVYVDVELLRRVPTAQSEKTLQATAPKDQPANRRTGYIPFDLIETPFSIAPGVGTEQRLALPIPGQYMSLLMRQYLGGAAISRDVIDSGGIGDTVAHGFGAENRWRLESGSVVIREWKWKHLRAMNDWNRPVNGLGGNLWAASASAGSPTSEFNSSPNFGLPKSSTNFRAASSTLHNFLLDGLSGDTGTELGSLLDCNTPFNNGLKMEIIGTPASVATNASYLYVVGHRLFGDLSRWTMFS